MAVVQTLLQQKSHCSGSIEYIVQLDISYLVNDNPVDYDTVADTQLDDAFVYVSFE